MYAGRLVSWLVGLTAATSQLLVQSGRCAFKTLISYTSKRSFRLSHNSAVSGYSPEIRCASSRVNVSPLIFVPALPQT
jgi:hypothetical protein